MATSVEAARRSVSIDTIRQSISIITKILSGRGLKVTQSGVQAYVDSVNGVPERINIPYIPDNASDELLLAINGFLDHEVAHVLFTDFKASTKEKFKNKAVFNIYNVLEDARIELEMRKKFAGSKTNLSGVAKFFIGKNVEPNYVKAKALGDAQEVVSSLFVSAIRSWFGEGQDAFAEFMSDKWGDIEPLVEKIKPAIPKIKTIRSTSDAVELAHEIYELLTKDQEQGAGGGKGKTPEDKGEGDKKSKSPNTDESGKSESNQEEDESDEGSEDEQDDDFDPDESDESGDDEMPDEEESEDEDDDDFDSDENEEKGSTPETEDEESDSEDDEEVSAISLTSDDFEEIASSTPDMSVSVAKVIAEEVKDDLKSANYKVYTTDKDEVSEFEFEHHNRAVLEHKIKEIETCVRKVTGPLQKTLERLIKAKTTVRNLPGKRSGRVNPSSLFRLKTGDTRVFRQREIGTSSDVAVSLVVDCSGSMHGEKINVAMQGAYALCDVLTKIGISNEVIGFTTLEDYDLLLEVSTEKERVGAGFAYSRCEPIYMPIFKGFNEKFGPTQKARIAAASRGGRFMRNNIDGESIRIAAKRLLSMTSEKGKQIIVLSDGSPAAVGSYKDQVLDLKNAVNEIEKAGVQMIGVGIMDDNVRRYYKNNVVIQNVEELPGLIIRELKALLV